MELRFYNGAIASPLAEFTSRNERLSVNSAKPSPPRMVMASAEVGAQ